MFNFRIKHKIKPVNDDSIKSFILNIRENFKADAKVLYNERNVIKLYEVNGKKYVVKSFKVPNLFNRVVYSFFRKSKAERSYLNTEKLEKLRVITPPPIAYVEYYSLLLIKESFYISEYFDYDFDMRDVLPCKEFDNRNNLFSQFIDFTFSLHNKGVYHLDYNHGNILIKRNQDNYIFCLIDVNRMQFLKMDSRVRMKSLAKLTNDQNDLDLMVQLYSRVSGHNTDKLMNHLKIYLNKQKRYLRNKKNIKKLLHIKGS
jgi:RIO-like serine/threonine protein kinase